MKTPTLIVRLIGIYLLVTGVYSLYTISQIPAIASGAAANQIELAKYTSAFSACIGLVAARYAGWFAKVLTFDSEPKSKNDDLSERVYNADVRDPKP